MRYGRRKGASHSPKNDVLAGFQEALASKDELARKSVKARRDTTQDPSTASDTTRPFPYLPLSSYVVFWVNAA